MPTYEYYCPANRRTVEVFHSFSRKLSTWGEVASESGLELGETPADAPVERLISGGTYLQRSEIPQPSGGGGG